jgi:hypothetical protein
MVEIVSSPISKWTIPKVRIEAKKLIEIIEKCVGEEEDVYAEVGKYRFNGIEDLKKNVELLAGNVIVRIGQTEIRLDNSMIRGVSHYPHFLISGSKQPGSLERSEAVAAKFNSYISEHRTYLRSFWGKIILALCPLIAASILMKDSDFETWEVFIYLFAIWSTSTLILDKLVDTKPVYFRDRTNFWSRNKDKLILGTIMLVVGTIVGWVTPQFFSSQNVKTEGTHAQE